MELREVGYEMVTGLNWLRIWSSGRHLWTL